MSPQALRAARPPPSSTRTPSPSTPKDAIVLFRKEIREGLPPFDLKLADRDWRRAGNSGYAAVVTGSVPTRQDARLEARKGARNLLIPNWFCRTDTGERRHRDGDLL